MSTLSKDAMNKLQTRKVKMVESTLKEDYAFSNGSACNSGSHAPSYVLTAMGLDENRISEAIRVSWNYNTQVDFTSLIDYVKAITE